MSDHQSVNIIPDNMENAPSLEQEAAAMEQQLGEPQAPQEVEVDEYTEERPAWLPEKFDSPEALAAAYASLQSEFSRVRGEQVEGEDYGEEGEIQIAPFSDEDMMPFTMEFEQTGDLSETSRQALAERGLPREMIDRYVEGMQAQTHLELMNVYDTVGGEDNYAAMVDWAAQNLDPQEQESFNHIVTTGDQNAMMFAVNSLRARWEASGQMPQPQLLQGDSGFEGAYERFESLAQVTAAMKDPRYKTDSAYRRSVELRLAQSQVL